MSSLTVLILVTFAAATLIVLALAMTLRDILSRRRDHIDHRLGLDAESFDNGESVLEQPRPEGRINAAFFDLIEASGSRLDHTAALALVIGLGLIGAVTSFVLTENVLAAAAGMVVGTTIPLLYWSVRGARRRVVMRKRLPEALDLVADAVRAGRNSEQAAAMVAAETPGPLGQEFSYCESQLRLGHSPVAVLERMVRRIGLPEFRIFATAVLVHRKSGGNLPILTERLAAAARDRQEFFSHLNAVTAGSKLSAIGLVLASVLGALALATIQPAYIERFLSHPNGPTMLAVAAILYTTGMVWVCGVLRIEY